MVCRHGHFFSSREAATDWTRDHPEGLVLSVTEAFERTRVAWEELGWARRSELDDGAGCSPRQTPRPEERRC
ncbi:MAG: organomercurial lyase [Actinomycetota bacterium]|nr:organomercurial lyase [Actinomycetota bacterium]